VEKRLCLSILLALVVINIVWVVASLHVGPVIGLTVYSVVAYLCWHRNHFQAGIIAGIVGLGVHIYEIAPSSLEGLTAIESGFLMANIVLPILLIYFSYRASRIVKKLAR
jgi:hypothetical protein